jgi:hypothetical protein
VEHRGDSNRAGELENRKVSDSLAINHFLKSSFLEKGIGAGFQLAINKQLDIDLSEDIIGFSTIKPAHFY